MEGEKDEVPRLFSVLPRKRPRVKMSKLKYMAFHNHKRKTKKITLGVVNRCGPEEIPLEIFKT